MDPLACYDRHHELIHSVFNSRLKIQILLTLAQGDAPLSRLREVTGSTSQALIPKIRRLEAEAIIEPFSYQYRLTPLGQVVADELQRYILLMSGIGQHQLFWATHDLSGIPPKFLARLGDLMEAEVKYETTVDMFAVYTHYLEILKDATQIHGLSSVASPGLAAYLAERVMAGTPVELVVSTETISLLQQEPYVTNLKGLAESDAFMLFVIREPLRIGLTVTDSYLSLGLFKKDTNLYDSSSDIFSRNPNAVAWGEEVFLHYRKLSSPVTISDIV
jgi:predicted transcriptional regulator